MTGEVGLVVTGPPSVAGWEFGGYEYGLEPLTLPAPGAPYSPPELESADGYWEICQQIRLIGERGVPAGQIEPCSEDDQLYWFRWITGHQISFIVWRLMAKLMDDVTEERADMADSIRPLCNYVRSYCAMLLYTGSCPRSTYHDVIRSSMRLRHKSFSGSWAPDYWRVRNLLRARQSPFNLYPELLQEIRLHQLVHDHVAAKLVPDGKSLLRQATVRRQDMRLLHLFYDNYFLTSRAPISRRGVVAQLIRRLVAIAQDVAVNSLHPSATTESFPTLGASSCCGVCSPPEIIQRTDEVVACEDGFTDILAQTAHYAVGLLSEGAPATAPPVAAR